MITQQSLRRQVLQYLRKKCSIKLQLPSFKRHVSDKINLKIFKSPLGQHFTENRYRILINLIEDLLKRNIINTQKIKEFGQCFFQTINQDLLVLQNNQQIRRNFTKIRDQITYRIEQLTVEQAKMEQQCKRISAKEDILIFLEGSFKTYLSNVKVVSDHYDGINGAQVYTSINIDHIYNQKLAHEEDYVQHYEPLLEVMQRLKSNMLKLYQELNKCEYYELPLKSVNFLANCKNLLLQLEPFLIKSDCVFNRLIFHVTRGQKQNNRLISNVFKSNIAFTNDIVSDIFKSFFLAYIFEENYSEIKEKIENQRIELISYFEQKQTNVDNFHSFTHKIEKKSQDIKNQIGSLRKVIGLGKDKIMREYLGRKQCKKGNMLSELQQREYKIRMLGNTMQQFLKYKNRAQYLSQKGNQVQRHVGITIRQLKQVQQNNIKTSKPLNANIRQIELQLNSRIKESYLMIQQGAISIQSLLKVLQQSKEEHSDPYFNQNYFPIQQKILNDLILKYNQYEISLLNHYQNLRRQKIQKGEQTLQLKSSILQELNDYFSTEISGEMGYEIRNQDTECQLVKDNIIKIQKMEFMINNYINNPNPNELQELRTYKINLEWLLQIFEGSMDEQIFEKFIQKLDFDAQDWKQRSKRVKQLIKQLSRYVNILKSILKSINISKINQKVFKLVKNRTQLYQILEDLYEEFNTIFQTCKQKTHLNISDHGLKIFDQATYQYVLMLYQYKNRMRAEIQEIKDLLLPKKTINYLIDQLYEPFVNNFNNFSTYSEQELLNFTLRLQHALNIKTSHLQITKLFEQTLSKPYHKDFFQSVLKISNQIAQLRVQNNRVLDLQEEEVMIYNLNQFKDRIGLMKEHINLAENTIRELTDKQLTLDIQLTNKQLAILRDKIVQDWNQHRDQAERSVSQSRADDFQHHQQP